MSATKRNLDDVGYNQAYEDKINRLEGALDEILNANSLVDAKEIAADLLEVDVDEFLVDDLDLEDSETDDLFENFGGERE